LWDFAAVDTPAALLAPARTPDPAKSTSRHLSAISSPLLARPVSTAVKEDRGIPTAELRDL
jgi:hypothetical protein